MSRKNSAEDERSLEEEQRNQQFELLPLHEDHKPHASSSSPPTTIPEPATSPPPQSSSPSPTPPPPLSAALPSSALPHTDENDTTPTLRSYSPASSRSSSSRSSTPTSPSSSSSLPLAFEPFARREVLWMSASALTVLSLVINAYRISQTPKLDS